MAAGMRIMGSIKNLSAKSFSDAFRWVAVDKVSRAMEIINGAHHEVHEGRSFFVNYSQSLASGEVAAIGITTPDTTRWLHLAATALVTAYGTFSVYEDCTSLSGGAAYTPRNQNRNSVLTSGATVVRGGTGANLITRTGGDSIFSTGFTSGVDIDWSRQSGEEMVLKQNSIYLFEIANGAFSNIVSITLRWYEHIDLD